MGKFLNSLQTKLIASFVLLILVIAGGTFVFTFGQTKKALLEITRQDVEQIIGIASTQFSVDEIQAISQLKPGQDDTPAYLALKQKFQNLRSQWETRLAARWHDRNWRQSRSVCNPLRIDPHVSVRLSRPTSNLRAQYSQLTPFKQRNRIRIARP